MLVFPFWKAAAHFIWKVDLPLPYIELKAMLWDSILLKAQTLSSYLILLLGLLISTAVSLDCVGVYESDYCYPNVCEITSEVMDLHQVQPVWQSKHSDLQLLAGHDSKFPVKCSTISLAVDRKSTVYYVSVAF